MPRLNIEDQFWLDMLDVISAFGDQDKAIGNALRFLRHAQEMHKHGRVMSEDEFRAKGFSEALIPIFAKRSRSGIEAVGSETHFAWLNQKSEAGKLGGQKSAKARKEKYGSAQPQIENSPKRPRSETKRTEASSSSSYSSSYSLIPNTTYSGAPALPDAKANEVIAAWVDAYERRYGTKYEVLGKDAGTLRGLGKGRSLDKIRMLFACYLAIEEKLYVDQGHPLSLFFRDLPKIVKAAQTGIDPSRKKTLAEEMADLEARERKSRDAS